jgi:hypothetical protein
LVLVSIVDGEFEFSFFGPENDGLPFHAADHVEGGFGLATQSHLQQIFLDACLDGFAQLGGDLKIPIGRTQPFNALMRALVIIIFDPETDSFARCLETFELSAAKKLLPDGFPEAFDFAQGHGMMRPGFEVVGAVLFHLGLETGRAPPVDVFTPVVGEHFLGGLVFGRRHPENLQHVLGGVAAEQIGSDDEPGIIVHEANDVGVLAAQPERENVRLPHLIGRGPFKEARSRQIAPRLRRALDQALFFEGLADRFAAGGQKEDPPQQLGYPFDPAAGFLLFEFQDLFPNRLG